MDHVGFPAGGHHASVLQSRIGRAGTGSLVWSFPGCRFFPATLAGLDRDWLEKTKDSLLTPAACCTEHLFRANSDYRGDASACATALPLVWAFSQEILSEYAEMQLAITSLNALYAVLW